VHVRRFQLSGFRNYRSLDLELPPGPLLFLGDNAQGKSNLLEAVALLATARSVRAGQDAEMIGWEAEEGLQAFARVHAQVSRRGGDVDLEAIVAGRLPQPSSRGVPGRAGKRLRVNGIARRAVDFVGQLRAVLFTAEDLEIVSGPPANRRAFLDTALSQADRGYYSALQRYGRLLQQRNATLRRIKEGMAGLDELSLWDEGFSREGAAIMAARNRAVRRLGDLAAESHVRLSGSALELLELAYQPQLGEQHREGLPADATATEVQPVFAAALAAQRRRETAAGLSLVGPHRDDVAIVLNGVAAAAFGSRAQIRTAALSMRLAEAELLRGGEAGDAPVLLLDDILSEMDEKRRGAVLGGLAGFDQVWITATSGSALPQAFLGEATVFGVEAGVVARV
jgi:DNA replication and repair protein RecF